MGMTAEEFLEHHGVKGMKWGVRKNRASVTPRKVSSDRKKVEELQKKGAHALSNKQLKSVKERLDLEQNFNRLTTKPSKVDVGHKKVKQVLEIAGTLGLGGSLLAVSKGPAGKALMNAGKKFIKGGAKPNAKELAALKALTKTMRVPG